MATKQGAVSVSVLQIGTGNPLPSAQTVLVGVDQIGGVFPTQVSGVQTGQGRFITNPATKIAVYARIDYFPGNTNKPTFMFTSDTVAQVLAKINA